MKTAAVPAVPAQVIFLEQGRFTVQRSQERHRQGMIQLKFKPHVLPEFQITLAPLALSALVDAADRFLT